MKRLRRLLILLATIACLFLVAVDERMIVRHYTIKTDKVASPIRLAALSDLHGDDYGPDYAQLTTLLEAEQPDAILMTGDMFSADGNADDELAFFCTIAGIAPCFYVTGNHEYWEYNVPALYKMIEATGVHVLDQTYQTLTVRGQQINICGIPDPTSGTATQTALAHIAEILPPTGYTILLSHRPELFEQYTTIGDFDLVLCGHAHGGQVRIPLLANGLYAPNQGFFPKYAGGRYDASNTTMIVSRGLVYTIPPVIPRVFNRPELLSIVVE